MSRYPTLSGSLGAADQVDDAGDVLRVDASSRMEEVNRDGGNTQRWQVQIQTATLLVQKTPRRWLNVFDSAGSRRRGSEKGAVLGLEEVSEHACVGAIQTL
eukprot:1952515-Rhodomonas_salina.2